MSMTVFVCTGPGRCSDPVFPWVMRDSAIRSFSSLWNMSRIGEDSSVEAGSPVEG